MKKHTFKQQKDFFMLGMDFNENGFQGLLGDYLHDTANSGIDFTVKMHIDTGAREFLIYVKGLPAILKQIPEIVCGYFNQLNSVMVCEYERDRKYVYTLVVTSWEEFIEQFGKTIIDKSKLTSRMNKVKKFMA